MSLSSLASLQWTWVKEDGIQVDMSCAMGEMKVRWGEVRWGSVCGEPPERAGKHGKQVTELRSRITAIIFVLKIQLSLCLLSPPFFPFSTLLGDWNCAQHESPALAGAAALSRASKQSSYVASLKWLMRDAACLCRAQSVYGQGLHECLPWLHLLCQRIDPPGLYHLPEPPCGRPVPSHCSICFFVLPGLSFL